MKQRVADYIADFLVSHNITDVFTVTGGGAMHLNDAFGHHPKLHCTYNHHEQACAIAAEAYARVSNKIAAVCVTTGPGGTNAITGVVGGWLDSIPMLIISGQVRYDTTARYTGLNLRAVGDQEFDIIKAVTCMTKYADMVIDPERIRHDLEKAFFLATAGRPGPSWLDIPLNVQAAIIETDTLVGYDPHEDTAAIAAPVSVDIIDKIIEKIKDSKRPVINAGSAIRYSGGFDVFQKLIEKINIPVVTGWNSIDLVPDDHPLYTGRAGIFGDRPGNFAIQNSDLVLSLGSRLSIRQVGYNFKSWAREAYTIVVDIDAEELKKPTVNVSLPVCADVKDVMEKLLLRLGNDSITAKEDWLEQCQNWKKEYPVVQQKHYDDKNMVNVYAFIKEISSFLPENQYTVVGNGSACVVGSHGYVIKKGQRFIINSAIASMGYDLPAAIGVCVAKGKQEIVCITGDGSIQMNLQELQTIITNKLPIKIFIINNHGYHSIRQTQKNFFGEPLVGIGPESGDLEFPDMGKIANAYGFSYRKCISNSDLKGFIQGTFKEKGPVIAEVLVSTTQIFEPKSATKRLDDGTLVSAPLEDLAPFLPREEFLKNMIIKPLDEEKNDA
ncbi:acetolactate synthase [Spirochaetia bacterium]|nr:acetolactate synthase [Spirochaetia bacterium]